MRIGEMVRAGGGPPMMLVNIADGEAECVWIDSHGNYRHRFCAADHLTPMWMTLGPKTLWPETGNLDLLEIEREEREAAAQKKAKRRRSRAAHRKQPVPA